MDLIDNLKDKGMQAIGQNPKTQDTSQVNSKSQKSDPAIVKLGENLNQTLRTLRMLEERYSGLRKKMQMSDQNMIEDTNKLFTQLKLISTDISDLKMKIEDMRQKLEIFSKEIDEMASKQEVTVLQRYIELWQPMNFMTEKEAIALIKDALKQKNEIKK